MGKMQSMGRYAGLLTALGLLWAMPACEKKAEDAAPSLNPRFVDGGILVDAPVQGAIPLGKSHFLARDWVPGAAVEIGGQRMIPPLKAQCDPLYHLDLGDVSRLAAMQGAAPDTALAFSSDGRYLAVGSYLGEITVLDAQSGQVLAQKRLAETMVKAVAFSADGQTLYGAEQSPDANIYAFDPKTLMQKWVYRLADDIETSAPPAGQDIYGVYTLPAAYGLTPMENGELLVTGTHGWNRKDGRRLNRSILLRLDAQGQVLARFPQSGAADALFKYPRVDREGKVMAVPVTRSADLEYQGPLPIGGVQVLEWPSLTPLGSHVAKAHAPHYKTAYIWEAVDISRADNALFMGFGDGRIRLADLEGTLRFEKEIGTPILAGDIPIAASVGFGFIDEGQLLFATSGTTIPYGSISKALRPPSAHPNENAIWALDFEGETQWTWSGPQRIQGLSRSDSGDRLIVGAGPRPSDERRDLFGAVVFDISKAAAGKTGAERHRYFCPTESPTFFRQAMSKDGLLAVAEYPYALKDGAIAGSYRLTVFR